LLADLAEMRGRQELFMRQAPQKLKALREHALIESVVSSNRIEGIEVDRGRAAGIVLKGQGFRDRNEEELAGYRDALNLIHTDAGTLELSETTIKRLHRLCRGEVWDAGEFKAKDGGIIETHPDGRVRVRFRTVPAAATPEAVSTLNRLWADHCRGERVHPLVALAGYNLDFLCIHPFRDGNGRVSRLLLLLQLHHLGYEAGRYVSIERTIEQNKERYYETLEQSSAGWHEGRRDPWPCITYLLFVLKSVCREFEGRVGRMASPLGAKTDMVRLSIERTAGAFTLRELGTKCPGVSRDMVRKVLRDMRSDGRVECVGRGPGARWRKKG
jgi:Fic family protein